MSKRNQNLWKWLKAAKGKLVLSSQKYSLYRKKEISISDIICILFKSTDSVFIGNLSYDADEESLKGVFEENGLSPSVRIITQSDGRSKG